MNNRAIQEYNEGELPFLRFYRFLKSIFIKRRKQNMVELGDRVKDKITGLEGIAVGITNYLYGCRRVSIQPEQIKDHKPADWFTIDEPQIEIVKKAAVAGRTIQAEENGPHGPREDAQRRKDVVR